VAEEAAADAEVKRVMDAANVEVAGFDAKWGTGLLVDQVQRCKSRES
jgi:hypothetical protein